LRWHGAARCCSWEEGATWKKRRRAGSWERRTLRRRARTEIWSAIGVCGKVSLCAEIR
jgi:hypothetical protein